MTLSDSGY